MSSKYDLTNGPIFQKLVKLSMPIMATSLMQTAHNLTNMFWLGFLDENYVAAAGMSGQFLWLSMSLVMLARIGTEIGVSQNIGKGEPETAKSFAQNGLMLAFFFGAVYASCAVIFRTQFISFFGLENEEVSAIAATYLGITAISLPFTFTHFLVTGVYSGFGNTKIPFYINTAALGLNIVLSPILIFGFNLGIIGAAVSMVAAAVFNLSMKIWAMTWYKNRPFEKFVPFGRIAWDKIKQILKWGVPVFFESAAFTMLFMVVSRLISREFGEGAVAAQSVGIQIESLAFMVGGGFASALTSFIGQNFGAKKWSRIHSTHRISFIFMGMYGILITAVLFILANPLVSIFLENENSIEMGTMYLRIIALTQVLFCLEGVVVGSFRGRGLTIRPTIVGISSNVLRVIVTYILASTALGINGVWIGIAIAMTSKSIVLLLWHKLTIKKLPKLDEVAIKSEI